jgi:hypothetical protein
LAGVETTATVLLDMPHQTLLPCSSSSAALLLVSRLKVGVLGVVVVEVPARVRPPLGSLRGRRERSDSSRQTGNAYRVGPCTPHGTTGTPSNLRAFGDRRHWLPHRCCCIMWPWSSRG